MSEVEYYRKIRAMTKREGISLFGVADLSKIRHSAGSQSLVDDLPYGISLGYRLSDRIIEEILDGPTIEYLHHYGQVNQLLDQTALKVVSYIQSMGSSALPVPASMITDWNKVRATFSHKSVAYCAGLGWIGRSGLIVNPRFGSRIRLVSVLTDLPLMIDQPVEGGCESCRECVKACPCGAIKERSEDFDDEMCLAQLRSFAKERNLGTQYICGICLKSCRPSPARTGSLGSSHCRARWR